MEEYIEEIKKKFEDEVKRVRIIKENRNIIAEVLEEYARNLEEEIKLSRLDIYTNSSESEYIGGIIIGENELTFKETENSIVVDWYINKSSLVKEYRYNETELLISSNNNEILNEELIEQECRNFIILAF